jgi:ribosomal protein L6P/L9E
MSDISKNSLFLPEGVKIDIENAKRPSDVKAVKWKKTAEVHDQVFLAAGIPASRNTSRIIGHP